MEKGVSKGIITFSVIFILFTGLSINSFFISDYSNCEDGMYTVGCSPLKVFSIYNFFVNFFLIFLFSLSTTFLFSLKRKWMFKLPALYVIFSIFLFSSGKFLNDMGFLWFVFSPGAWISAGIAVNAYLKYGLMVVESVVAYFFMGLFIDFLFNKFKKE